MEWEAVVAEEGLGSVVGGLFAVSLVSAMVRAVVKDKKVGK